MNEKNLCLLLHNSNNNNRRTQYEVSKKKNTNNNNNNNKHPSLKKSVAHPVQNKQWSAATCLEEEGASRNNKNGDLPITP